MITRGEDVEASALSQQGTYPHPLCSIVSDGLTYYRVLLLRSRHTQEVWKPQPPVPPRPLTPPLRHLNICHRPSCAV